MLTAHVEDKGNTFRIAFLTMMSIFIMGYVNALAINTLDLGTMITPQTGNVIWLGITIASGDWPLFIQYLGLFGGFVIGAIFALFTQNLFKERPSQFYWNWTFFILPIVIYPIFLKYNGYPVYSFLALGFSAGAALGFFRKVYHMELNNSMATGNVRFFGIHFAQAFFKKYKPENRAQRNKEITAMLIFLIAIVSFAGGAATYVRLALIDFNVPHSRAIRLSINDYDVFIEDFYDAEGNFIESRSTSVGFMRQTYGAGDFEGRSVASNIYRVGGLIILCVIPYLFAPRHCIIIEVEKKSKDPEEENKSNNKKAK
ncbi:MAG: DUF1275 domain-containing protein [Defluviitaleaceae bacterium]|nr:DUF1275 domain-containing protein [Defluviitaleaceae bacterium]